MKQVMKQWDCFLKHFSKRQHPPTHTGSAGPMTTERNRKVNVSSTMSFGYSDNFGVFQLLVRFILVEFSHQGQCLFGIVLRNCRLELHSNLLLSVSCGLE